MCENTQSDGGTVAKNNAIRIYLPDNSGLVPFVEGYLSGQNGGATTFDAKGNWLNGNKELITENVKVVESVTESDTPAKDAKELAQAAKDKPNHNEDEIMWEVRPIRQVGFE